MDSSLSTDSRESLVEDPLDCMLDGLVEHEGQCRDSGKTQLSLWVSVREFSQRRNEYLRRLDPMYAT